MVTGQKETKGTNAMVEELLQAVKPSELIYQTKNLSSTLIALGILEIVFGALAVSLPFYSSAFFVLLLGAVVLVSGVIQMVSSLVKGTWGRFFLGIVSIAAGALIIAHPLFNLAFLTLLLAAYFIAGGIARLVESRESGWMIASGILGVFLGVIVLAGWPVSSAFAVGLIVGVNVLFSGIATLVLGTTIKSRLRNVPQ